MLVCVCVHARTHVCVCVQTHIVTQMVKSLPAVQDTRVQSLGQEGPLEKGMATHSSILAWRIPWTEAGVHRVSKNQT